jgi:hypothetical protein
MVAGVPGAGISAFFYLIAVLAMPFVAGWRAARARSLGAGRWRLVGRQLVIATGIALGLVAAGVLVALLAASASPAVTAEQAAQVAWQVGSTLSQVGVALGLVTLAAVVGTVQLVAVIDGWRRHRPSPAHRPTHTLEPLWSPTEPGRRTPPGRHED